MGEGSLEPMSKAYYVYIMTNKRNTVLYTGMTRKAAARFAEHGLQLDSKSFAARYHINKVIYLEVFSTPEEAAAAEKKIKGWTRKKKLDLIHSVNPTWEDLVTS